MKWSDRARPTHRSDHREQDHREQAHREQVCECGKKLKPAQRKFCSRSCASKSGRRAQLVWEESMAKKMEEAGWRIFSPTACCDRIAIKNGRVYFIEFKPAGRTKLRAYQKAVQAAAPHMYRVVVGPAGASSEVKILHIAGAGTGLNLRNVEFHGIRAKTKSPTTSRFKGVNLCKKDQMWRARMMVNGKRVSLGYFSTEDEAGRVYDEEMRRYTGKNPNMDGLGHQLDVK